MKARNPPARRIPRLMRRKRHRGWPPRGWRST
ncbi:hypothetical protein COLO4_22819 [Corchorus olitorius]|uniref:Uncharacterized protein n=1 Tax=Corchorus olitorius TaxID=93759 RepID=A0A1R3IJR7_9ROSI|nr:hypothetical protein COLO4_22819 [Corchorus olitorius]